MMLVLHLRLGRLALVLCSSLSQLMLELGSHALGLAPLEGNRGLLRRHLRRHLLLLLLLRRHLLLLRRQKLRCPSLALSRCNELLTHTTHLRLQRMD